LLAFLTIERSLEYFGRLTQQFQHTVADIPFAVLAYFERVDRSYSGAALRDTRANTRTFKHLRENSFSKTETGSLLAPLMC